jgi:ABC-type nickel/cobalt efflux system permease component RcnA
LALPLTALAHPLGNFTVNRYSRIEIGGAGVKIYYVLDMAEIPTFQEKEIIDQNQDGQISEAERLAYLDRKAEEIKANLKLTVDSAPQELKIAAKDLSFPAGQGGLQTTRLTARFETSALPANSTNLSYQDNNFSDRLGWKEVVVRNASGVALLQTSAPATDQSNELRVYPEDMLASPLNLTSAQVSFKPDASVVVNNPVLGPDSAIVKADDPFAALIKGDKLTIPVILVSFLIAFGLGMFHALSPGHGKAIVGAYLVGTRGTTRHAAFLGLTVTITHTIGVFALGLLTLLASQFILPEKLYPWLGLASGLIVLLMGFSLLRSRLRFAVTGQPSGHEHHHHEPDADHAHEHHFHSHREHEHHSHNQSDHQPGLPTHEHPDHSHDHHHRHEQDHTSEQVHHHSGLATLDSLPITQTHSHGGPEHSHLPPGTDGTAVTWRRLHLFGISAGLLPCPSALVVLLSAIALGRTAFGLVLIIFFSLGLAATLTLMGLLYVYARKLLADTRFKQLSGIIRIVPVASALIVTILGLIISCGALIQTGLLSR